MRESSARRSRASSPGALAGLLLLLVVAACGGESPSSAPTPSPTPITRLNTTSMQVPRIEFCPLVRDGTVTTALGGKADSDASYGNGDEERLPGVGSDVVHEIGCSWTAEGEAGQPTVARAWVFARPVEARFASSVIAAGKATKGCRTVAGPAYGEPSTTQVCSLAGTQRVRHAGLFGQTWLTCELQAAPSEELRSRADRWCVEVANALNTAR